MVRFGTAPTGPGGHIELPKYLFKLHQTAPTGPGGKVKLPKYFIKLHQTALGLNQELCILKGIFSPSGATFV